MFILIVYIKYVYIFVRVYFYVYFNSTSLSTLDQRWNISSRGVASTSDTL